MCFKTYFKDINRSFYFLFQFQARKRDIYQPAARIFLMLRIAILSEFALSLRGNKNYKTSCQPMI